MFAPVRLFAASLVLVAMLATGAWAQLGAQLGSPQQTRAAYKQALEDQKKAQQRSQTLEADAARAVQAADKTARDAAVLAAQIQEAEAGIAAAEARIALIAQQSGALRARMALRQKPVMQLTAALQKFSRRPVAMSVLRPGSVRDMVYLRAMLSNTVPEVRRRTAALRSEMDRGLALEREARQAATTLRSSETSLTTRRKALAALETRQRLASRQASGAADREVERALALAEQARDLDQLVGQLDKAGTLRQQLAALPGPIIRPPRPVESLVMDDPVVPAPGAGARLAKYRLPVTGQTMSGFGAPTDAGALSQGITLRPRPGALIVAPAAGRVAFAGPYRGYGRIVIVEHSGGWTSLVTGLVRTDVAVGETLLDGSPLGIAAPRNPQVTVELRRDGVPVNPLSFLAG